MSPDDEKLLISITQCLREHFAIEKKDKLTLSQLDSIVKVIHSVYVAYVAELHRRFLLDDREAIERCLDLSLDQVKEGILQAVDFLNSQDEAGE